MKGIIGRYGEMGYRIEIVEDGETIEEVYSAGNAPGDSQGIVPPSFGVPVERLRTWCEEGCREEAEERGMPFFGVELEEGEKKGDVPYFFVELDED